MVSLYRSAKGTRVALDASQKSNFLQHNQDEAISLNTEKNRDVNIEELSQDELITRMLSGDLHARDRLILINGGMVVSIARGYISALGGLDLEDVIQEGYRALIKAVDTFNPQRGRLSTHAFMVIRRAMTRYIMNHKRNVRIPFRAWYLAMRVKRSTTDLAQKLEHPPSLQEISLDLNLSTQEVDFAMPVFTHEVSLDSRYNNTNSPLGYFSVEQYVLNGQSLVLIREQLRFDCTTIVDILNTIRFCSKDHNVRIFIQRYGIHDDFEPVPTRTMASRLGVTRQAIEQSLKYIWNRLNIWVPLFDELLMLKIVLRIQYNSELLSETEFCTARQMLRAVDVIF